MLQSMVGVKRKKDERLSSEGETRLEMIEFQRYECNMNNVFETLCDSTGGEKGRKERTSIVLSDLGENPIGERNPREVPWKFYRHPSSLQRARMTTFSLVLITPRIDVCYSQI